MISLGLDTLPQYRHFRHHYSYGDDTMKNRPALRGLLLFLLGVLVGFLLFPQLVQWFPYIFMYIYFALYSPLSRTLLLILVASLALGFLLRKLATSIPYHNLKLKLFSRSATVYLQRGDLYLNRKSYNEAIADFDQAIALHPTAT